MMNFMVVKNDDRYVNPQIVGDILVREKLEKYLSEREKIIGNIKYDLDKIALLERKNLSDDFGFWFREIDKSYINDLIRNYKKQKRIK